ncbi:family 1 glycosylhydrolase [Lachnobacterium bovis]|uniref:family 1 glycosylhydrolase n=1 Tax=Lachnobacterium bovis TaxID=140626 RepID=UPI0004903CA3|nr:family 1 glycosylhydrolase [Lachnobacterium bovis]
MLRNDFVWGVATSSYQIEGKDEKIPQGECVWDTFIKKEGTIFGGHNADVACDELHKYKRDIPMMANLGIKAYRFSLNWARIIPDGTGRINQEGINYYREVLELLNKYNITPYITLFHWEYLKLYSIKVGWLNPDCV